LGGIERSAESEMLALRIVNRLPLPMRFKLMWQKSLTDQSYAKEIKRARTAKNVERVKVLESERQVDIGMFEEEEAQLYTRQLLGEARRLRVPCPRMYGHDGKQTVDWEEGHYVGHWHLTEVGIEKIRKEIRKELRWGFERRRQWVLLITTLTGIIGALIGLVAILTTR